MIQTQATLSSLPSLPKTHSFDVAVFPMPDAVLFPGVTLPLHIFEDRYGQMIKDIRDKGWPLAVSLTVPESDHEVRLSSICGAGPIQIFKEYEDGASDILVHGRERVRLLKFVQQKPYFIMEAQVVEPENVRSVLSDGREFEEFRALLKAWAFLNPDVSNIAIEQFDRIDSMGGLCDYFAFHFLKRVADKQVLLNCVPELERADRLSELLEKDLLRISRKVGRENKARLMH